MRNLYLLITLVLCIVSLTQARNYLTVDTFAQGGSSVTFLVPTHSYTENYWWTPYRDTVYGENIKPPVPGSWRFHNTVSALGGQRDIIAGYEDNTEAGASNIITIITGLRRGDVAFSLNYIGGAYFQWDGADSDGGTDFDRGVYLNSDPGVGPFVNTTAFPERDSQGRWVDFTTDNKAIGINIDTIADHAVFYYFDALDSTGTFNSFAFTAPVSSNPVRRWILYTDAAWDLTPAAFNWKQIVAFAVRIWTFAQDEVPSESVAIDTSFAFLRTFGLIIPGTVQVDCDCNGVGESPVASQTMNLYLGSTGNTVALNTAVTDSTGFFLFSQLADLSPLLPGTTYTVCLNDLARPRCPNDNGCRTTTTSNLQNPPNNNIDPVNLTFFYTASTGITCPAAQTVECGGCISNICLGNATASSCIGGSTTVSTFNDVGSGTCPRTITRTFTFEQQSCQQIITITDTINPSITTPAQSQSVQCSSSTPTMASWVQSNGGAIASDCNTFVWSNNWDNSPPNCGSESVTFTVTDLCGNIARTTASFTILDSTVPSFNPVPQSSQAQCNQNNNSDFNALTAWLNSNGGGVASDNCGNTGLTVTNNYVDGSLQRGCSNSIPVIFTARDSCGNVFPATATFTILDTTPPSLTTPASNQSGDCNSGSSSFNQWLQNNGGAVASDTCRPVTWSNNASGAPGGCNDGRTVTFTADDGCGQTVQTTATFTIADNSPPTITQQASPLNIDCNAANQQQQLNNWLQSNGGASATDACSGVNWTNNFSSNSGSCNSVPVTFTACDSCASGTNDSLHCSRTTASYSINDTEPPTFNPAPTNSQAECGPNAQTAFTAWLNNNAGAIAADNCAASSEIVVTNNWPVGTLPALGCQVITPVEFRARDPCGRTSSPSTATFTISDNTPPTFTNFAADQQINCASNQNTQYNSWIQSNAGATATDTCTSVSISAQNPPSTPNFQGCSGSTTVTFVARDQCNLSVASTATFSIVDNTPPTLTTPASDLNVECTGTGSSTNTQLNNWIQNNGGARATDTCSQVTWTNSTPNLSGTCNAQTTVTFTASDACGQQVSTQATFSQTDSVGPTITTPAQPRTVPCNADTQTQFAQWLNSNGGAVASDACQTDPVTWTNVQGDGLIGCDFETVTFIASDACGLSARTTATFTSTDTSAPTFSPPAQDLSVECNANGNQQDYNNWLQTNGGAVAVDACAFNFVWTNNAPTNAPQGCGTQPVTFTVTDNCQNSARTTATFRVNDSIPPQFTTPPSDRNVECDGNGNTQALTEWVQSNGGGVAVDSCSTNIQYTQTPQTQTGNSCRSVRPYNFRAADNCGNVAVATASFIITDSTAPTINPQASPASFECDGNGNSNQINQWVSSRGGAMATDICQGAPQWTNDFPSMAPVTCTSILVRFTATDACGFATSTSATLSITDVTPPTFSNFPQNVTVPCDADISVAFLGEPDAFDTCAGELFVTLTETAIDEPPVGNCPGDHVITRNWAAVDDCGNTISRNQVIRVQIVRSSGPCDPTGCECDDCCPPPAASNCLSAPCSSSPCSAVPCTATACTCANGNAAREVREIPVSDELIEPLPQCKPVYIYVNDDDDSAEESNEAVVAQQRMLVTSEPLHESAFRNKSSASTLCVSLLLSVFAFALLLF